jgi:hypothetical protein
MSEQEILGAVDQSGLSFVGTVERLGAATMAGVPVNDRTAVIRVEQVLHSPELLKRLSGMSVTVQLRPDADLPSPGDRAAFFTNPTVFGEGLVTTEVVRLPVSEIDPLLATATPGEGPLDRFQRALEDQQLLEHAEQADAIVVGKVARLVDAGLSAASEHDPDWWRATFDVIHVERGPVTGPQVDVLYANSQDVLWRNSPKPRASQEGVWLLHSTEDGLRNVAPFEIPHPEDYQPVTRMEQLRSEG